MGESLKRLAGELTLVWHYGSERLGLGNRQRRARTNELKSSISSELLNRHPVENVLTDTTQVAEGADAWGRIAGTSTKGFPIRMVHFSVSKKFSLSERF